MSTWTDQLKSSQYTTNDFVLLIDDTHYFLIDDNYKLTVDTGLVPTDTSYINQPKS